GESFEVISEPGDLVAARTALQEAGIEYESAEAAFLPAVEIELDEDQARRVFRLMAALAGVGDVTIRELTAADDLDALLDLSCRAFGPVGPADRERWQAAS